MAALRFLTMPGERHVTPPGVHCRNRRMEWSLSAMMVGCGILLLLVHGSIAGSAFRLMLDVGMRQETLGPFFFTFGLLRALALWHNGNWPVWGPRLRAVGALAGMSIWGQLLLALVGFGLTTGLWPLGVPVFFVLLVDEGLAIDRAVRDVQQPA